MITACSDAGRVHPVAVDPRVRGPVAGNEGEMSVGRVTMATWLSDSRMVALGFGKFARADRIYALERIAGERAR